MVAARRDELRQQGGVEDQRFRVEDGNAQAMQEQLPDGCPHGADMGEVRGRGEPASDPEPQKIDDARPFDPGQDISRQFQQRADAKHDKYKLQADARRCAKHCDETIQHAIAQRIGDGQRHIGAGNGNQAQGDQNESENRFHIFILTTSADVGNGFS